MSVVNFFLFFYFARFIALAIQCCSLTVVVAKIRVDITGASPPSSLRCRLRLHFYRENNEAFYFLIDARRIVQTYPTAVVDAFCIVLHEEKMPLGQGSNA